MHFHLFDTRSRDKADSSGSEPFGTLIGVRHESSGGSMAFRSEFSIEVSPCEIVRCAYWPEDHEPGMVTREHIPVTPEQWADVEDAVRTLWPLFRKVDPTPVKRPDPDLRVLDGGDYSRWFLTRQTADGVVTRQYYQPDDRRICTLIELLRELAEPIGRTIPRYAPPELCGVYFQSERLGCSYQCTLWEQGEEDYRYISNDTVDKEKRSVYERVPNEIWDAVRAFCDSLELSQCPSASGQDTQTCTLYYSDGKQRRVSVDNQTAKALKAFFRDLTTGEICRS